jgi:hypothetical protein
LLTEKQLRRGVHRSTHELEAAIERYLTVYNEAPKPFVWTKTAGVGRSRWTDDAMKNLRARAWVALAVLAAVMGLPLFVPAGTLRRSVLPMPACAVAGQLPEGVVCAMRGVDLGDRPTPQLPHRVLEVVSQDGEGSTHTRFTAGSQAVGVGATDLDRLGP